LRVGTDTPRAMPAQLDAFFAQYPPNRRVRNAQRLRPRYRRPIRPTLSAPATPIAAKRAGAAPRRISAFRPAAADREARRCLAPQTVCATDRPCFGRTPSSRDTSSLRLPSRQARTILAR
jgi:hypothetical protein